MLPKIRTIQSDARRFIKDKIFRKRFKRRLLPEIHDKDFIKTEFGSYRKFDLSDNKYKSFCIYFVDLAGKLIIADGVPNKKELEELNNIFSVSDQRILNLLKESYEGSQPIELSLRQINKFFGLNKTLFKKLIFYLVKIGLADGPINNMEAEFLKKLCNELSLDVSVIEASLRALMIPASRDPYIFLNVSRNISISSLNREYRQVASSCHPDKFMAYDYAEEYILILTEKFNLINKAYNLIKEEI